MKEARPPRPSVRPSSGDSVSSMYAELDELEEYIGNTSSTALRMTMLQLRAQIALVSAVEALRRDFVERP